VGQPEFFGLAFCFVSELLHPISVRGCPREVFSVKLDEVFLNRVRKGEMLDGKGICV
jgi:hypothetical protein